MTAPNLDSTAAAEHFFAGAVAAGMTDVVISPGSRSTPLTIAADRTPGLSVHVHLDERGAAFAALGYAKASGTPVGLVCTSGTAAANYLPAISEASLSNVSIVAITADRPPEHQHVGIGQSFDQRGLFHRQIRAEITMPVGGEGGAAFTVRAGWRAIAESIEQHGPVHVNWPFRLPLEPQDESIEAPTTPPPCIAPQYIPQEDHLSRLTDHLGAASAPIIVAGPSTSLIDPDRKIARQVLSAAERLGIPVLADVLSGIRGHTSPTLIEAPALLGHTSLPVPDLIIRLGHTPTAKATRLWWEGSGAPQVLIDPLDDWQDPSSAMCDRLRCSPGAALESASLATPGASPGWLEQWIEAGTTAHQVCMELLHTWPTTTEAHLAFALGAHAGADDVIIASSSMPIRDLDSFTSVELDATVHSNRGINGIDGVVSTAIGVSRAQHHGRTFVHIGDVATLHDIGGVLDAARQGVDLTIIIPNNDGGGIFSFLPARTALESAQFESLFHTPHGTSFDFLAGHPKISHHYVKRDLESALARCAEDSGITILEVPVSTEDRLDFDAQLQQSLRSR
jgi:2-succinyl-5-enolpyruvyl-6-hydroxy-3-cyclohexene-1-carboxylate synthase